MIEDYARRVRLDLRLDEPDKPDWDFTGLYYPYDLFRRVAREYHDHGVLFTEYMAQPPEFWEAVELDRAIYNTLYLETLPDAEDKWKKERGE